MYRRITTSFRWPMGSEALSGGVGDVWLQPATTTSVLGQGGVANGAKTGERERTIQSKTHWLHSVDSGMPQSSMLSVGGVLTADTTMGMASVEIHYSPGRTMVRSPSPPAAGNRGAGSSVKWRNQSCTFVSKTSPACLCVAGAFWDRRSE